jgi:hypothetical protein
MQESEREIAHRKGLCWVRRDQAAVRVLALKKQVGMVQAVLQGERCEMAQDQT